MTASRFCKGTSHAMMIVMISMMAIFVTPAIADATPAIHVVDADSSQPLAGASLHLIIDNERHEARTDDAGRFTDWPAQPHRSLLITAHHPGHVPVRLAVDLANVNGELLLPLPPGHTLGGIVHNDAGQPLADATVTITIRGRTAAGHAIDLRDVNVHTDEMGRWRFTDAPAPDARIMLWLTVDHRDHHATGQRRVDPDTRAALYQHTAQTQLDPATVLAGRVLDTQGQPIADARVAHGRAICGTPEGQTRTDDEGRFRIAFLKPTRVPVTIQAPDHAPLTRELTLNGDEGEHTFNLTTGTTLRGRVVDSDGQPIANVSVRLQGVGPGASTVAYWSSQTDDDGRFEWPHAPTDELRISFSRAGYTNLPFQPLRAGEQQHTITLHRALTVTGNVTDAETGEPVERFTLIPGLVWQREPTPPPLWQRHSTIERTDGSYQHEFTRGDADHMLRVEALGYRPAISPIWRVDDGPQTHDFQLTPADPITGRVRTPQGEPAAGATVYLVTPGQQLQVTPPSLRAHAMGAIDTRTNNDGRFQLPPEAGSFSLLVLHDDGYIQIDDLDADDAEPVNEQLQAIQLTPWARLEGRVMRGDQPLPDETIRLHLQQDLAHRPDANAPRIFWSATVYTDDDGRFAFYALPEGEAGVGRVQELGGGMSTTTNPERVTLKAGQTHEVQLGGDGRHVIGRLRIPDDIADRLNPHTTGITIVTQIDYDRPPQPDNWQDISADERREWQQAWLSSDEGIAFQQRRQDQARERRHFRAMPDADGRFRVEDVPAGEYQLRFDARSHSGDRLGTAGRTFTIDPIDGGDTDQPLDLEDIPVTPVATLGVGDEAPPFEIEDLDGNPLRLADYRGQFVLLDFWATWCGPCIAETPNLKRVYDAFGDDDRFELIALSLDHDRDAPRRYAQDNDLQWVQGFLGAWSNTDLPEQYAVHGIPQIMLIGPDGRVIARNLRGENIYHTVANTLQTHREP